MDDENDVLDGRAFGSGSYYDAVGHTDVVYRVLEALEESPTSIPEYPLIVVDEYQDFNPLDTSLIETLESAARS